jgi:hypothetical protein
MSITCIEFESFGEDVSALPSGDKQSYIFYPIPTVFGGCVCCDRFP